MTDITSGLACQPFRHDVVGERLLAHGVISRQQLDHASEMQSTVGVHVGKALIDLGFVDERTVATTIAKESGLPFLDIRPENIDADVVRRLPEHFARNHGIVALWQNGPAVVVGFTDPPDSALLTRLEDHLTAPVQPRLVTDADVEAALHGVYRAEYLDIAADRLGRETPSESAIRVITTAQKVCLILMVVGIAAGFIAAPVLTLMLVAATSTFFVVGFSLYKLHLVRLSLSSDCEVPVSDDEIANLDERTLPIYTILVPVYREAEVLPILVRAMGQLDYPLAKLDVRILLEEDDQETIAAARQADLPSFIRPVIVPKGTPRGKPRACNYGLIHARGEFVVIFDAEDIPEPDQLKKAVIAFSKGGERLACVQAKLNYFNGEQNVLTRWFTAEYSTWFDLFLPGLSATDSPIPLGGTSNHFRMSHLRSLGAWDPYNVTEDADLGIRLFKSGFVTSVIDSTTYEEANSEVYNWIRQRSRWIKGYIVTYLVHMRNPIGLIRSIGILPFISFQLFIGGTPAILLLNPLFWVLTVLWFLTRADIIEAMFPPQVFYLGAAALYLGNFVFAYMNILGCLRRQQYGSIKYALLSPIYWALMSIAAWKGFIQLFYAPSYWEKTNHGLYKADGSGVGIFLSDGASRQPERAKLFEGGS